MRRTDPAVRRWLVVLVVCGTVIGALLIALWERYRVPLREWVLSEPAEIADRVRLVILLLALFLSAPLVVFAAHLWSLGVRVERVKQFPPPGYRLARNAPVVGGAGAIARARGLKLVALCLGVGAAVLWILLWRIALALGARAAT